MKNLYNSARLIILTILVFSFTRLGAQVSTGHSFSYTTATYTAVSGGTTLASGTGASMDDALYTGIPIGFTFKFNNVNYTTVGVSTNGFIWFGSNNPLSTTYSPISYAGSMDAAISVYGRDLIGHPAATSTPGIALCNHRNGSKPNIYN
jgi:hypothetical protein